MGMRIAISSCVAQIIRQATADAHPREACGLLFGEEDAITSVQITENVAQNPELHFEIDPVSLFAALRGERAGGPRLIGYWHSHPTGDPTPSATDAATAEPDGKLWLIAGAGELRGWLAGESGLLGRFTAVELANETGLKG